MEIRVAPADDIPLSTAYARDSFYLAFHTHQHSDWATHAAYMEAMEAVMRAHDGRPHWGKLHTRTAADLAPPNRASATSWPCATGPTPTGSSQRVPAAGPRGLVDPHGGLGAPSAGHGASVGLA